MNTLSYRLYLPVANWYTRRSDIELQRVLVLAPEATPPRTVEELRHLVDTGQVAPAPGKNFCVNYGGTGHYFDTHGEALAYICHRWGTARILNHLDEATEYAATQRPAALALARDPSLFWQKSAESGGGAAL